MRGPVIADRAIDVIMPLYRGKRWVPETIAMLREQTFTDWHLIAVDDACPQQTGDLVADLIPDADVVRLDGNGGPARARNIAVGRSQAPYVALLDQDDMWHPTKLERQMAALAGRPDVGVCGTNAMLIDEHGRPLGEEWSNRLRDLEWETMSQRELLRAQFLQSRVKTASTVVRRDAWEQVGGQIEFQNGGEDWALWFSIIACGWRVAHIPESLHYWRQHDANTSRSLRRNVSRYRVQMQYGVRHWRCLGVGTVTRGAGVMARDFARRALRPS